MSNFENVIDKHQFMSIKEEEQFLILDKQRNVYMCKLISFSPNKQVMLVKRDDQQQPLWLYCHDYYLLDILN